MKPEIRPSAPLAAALDSAAGLAGLSPDMVKLISVRLEEALADPRDAPLTGLDQELAAALRAAIAHAPGDLVDAIRNVAGNGDLHRLAYLLGQIGMAQAVTARARDRRAGEAFASELKSEGLAPYVRALLDGSLSNSELADAVSERLETVSRKLKRLRDMGAADFRRDGVLVHNFLTPAAEAIAKSWPKDTGSLPKPKRKLDPVLKGSLGELGPLWQNSYDFSTDGAFSDVSH